MIMEEIMKHKTFMLLIAGMAWGAVLVIGWFNLFIHTATMLLTVFGTIATFIFCLNRTIYMVSYALSKEKEKSSEDND